MTKDTVYTLLAIMAHLYPKVHTQTKGLNKLRKECRLAFRKHKFDIHKYGALGDKILNKIASVDNGRLQDSLSVVTLLDNMYTMVDRTEFLWKAKTFDAALVSIWHNERFIPKESDATTEEVLAIIREEVGYVKPKSKLALMKATLKNEALL